MKIVVAISNPTLVEDDTGPAKLKGYRLVLTKTSSNSMRLTLWFKYNKGNQSLPKQARFTIKGLDITEAPLKPLRKIFKSKR